MTQSRTLSRSPRPLMKAVMVCLAVLIAGMVTGCGQENDGQAAPAPLEERSPNDLPLNPPALRFRVGPDGTVGASPERRAEAGEAVAFVLENDSEREVKLLFLGPDEDQVFALTAGASERRDGRALPRTTGRHYVEVFPAGDRAAAQRFPVEVTEN